MISTTSLSHRKYERGSAWVTVFLYETNSFTLFKKSPIFFFFWTHDRSLLYLYDNIIWYLFISFIDPSTYSSLARKIHTFLSSLFDYFFHLYPHACIHTRNSVYFFLIIVNIQLLFFVLFKMNFIWYLKYLINLLYNIYVCSFAIHKWKWLYIHVRTHTYIYMYYLSMHRVSYLTLFCFVCI